MKITLLILLAALKANSVWADTVKVVHMDSDAYNYRKELLKTALEYSDRTYTLKEVTEIKSYTQNREIRDVLSESIDVICLETSPTVEKTLKPIRIPIYKSFFNFQLLLIREDSQHYFNKIATIDDLKKITIGQLVSRSNTQILKNNNFRISESISQENLIRMLERGRIDAILLPLYEIKGVLKDHPRSKLKIEGRLIMKFNTPFYFFVHPLNKQLAFDIEKGLLKMEKIGVFNRLFFSSDLFQDTLEISDLKNRIAIDL